MIKISSPLFSFGIVVILISVSFIVLYEIPTTPDNLIERQYDRFEVLIMNHYLFKDKEGIPETITYSISIVVETLPAFYYGGGSFQSKYDTYSFSFKIHDDFLVLLSIEGYDDNCLPRESPMHAICTNYKPLDQVD